MDSNGSLRLARAMTCKDQHFIFRVLSDHVSFTGSNRAKKLSFAIKRTDVVMASVTSDAGLAPNGRSVFGTPY